MDGTPYAVVLPSPLGDEGDKNITTSKGVLFVGPSAIFLEPIRLSGSMVNGEESSGDDTTIRIEASKDFDLSYLPLVTGFSTVGGLRIILIEDQLVDEDQAMSNDADSIRRQAEVQILKEWQVIGEIWVKT
jgi:hypothetical protein